MIRVNVWDIVSQPDASYLIKQVELNEGPLDQFSHDMEPFLRKQGMPVKLNRAILMRLWYASSNKFSSDAIYCQFNLLCLSRLLLWSELCQGAGAEVQLYFCMFLVILCLIPLKG